MSATSRIVSVSLTCILNVVAIRSAGDPATNPTAKTGIGTFQSTATPNAQFSERVRPQFVALVDTAFAYADYEKPGRGLTEEQIRKLALAYQEAQERFRRVVIDNWPHKGSGSGAMSAFQAAQKFHQEEYRSCRATREQAAARYLAVADRFPDSFAARDKALGAAANLYMQGLMCGAKRDEKKAAELFKRVTARTGPLTPDFILAEVDLSSWNDDPATRKSARSEYYKKLETRRDPKWLAETLLVPTDAVSAEEFAQTVGRTLVVLRSMQLNTMENMVADAAVSPDPETHADELRAWHKGDALVHGKLDDVFGARVAETDRQSGFWLWMGVIIAGLVVIAGIAVVMARRPSNAQSDDKPTPEPG